MGQSTERQGLTEGIDYVLVATGEPAPFDGVVLTREAMDTMLNERQWFLDLIDAHERGRAAAEELIILKEEQIESYRKDLRGARIFQWAGWGAAFVFTGISLANER